MTKQNLTFESRISKERYVSEVADLHCLRKCNASRQGLSSSTTVIAILLVVAFATAIYYFAMRPGKSNEDLITYTVRRDDLNVSIVEQGTLESSENTEIKCQVRGKNTITWVIESGTYVNEGDKLVTLDTLALEEAINERAKFALLTRASAERLEAAKESAKLAVKEYAKGTFVNDLKQLEKSLVVARSDLKAAENLLRHEQRLAARGFASELQIAESRIVVQQYENQVAKLEEEIKELKSFTRKQQLATLEGDRDAAIAEHNAEFERMNADAIRWEQAKAELKHCTVTAPRSGLVIHPSAAQWQGAPDIEEGATVHKTQVMLLMPNLKKMQVKVGVHESVVDRVKPEMKAVVVLNDRKIECQVLSVASITRPAGWWTGNVVKYDTIIKIPENEPRLKPGMSAEVRIILAEHKDVVTVPVAAVLQTDSGDFCWVKDGNSVKRRILEIGDSNDVFIHVKSGLKEGDQVVLNPLSYIDEAEAEALMPKQPANETSTDESKNKTTANSSGRKES